MRTLTIPLAVTALLALPPAVSLAEGFTLDAARGIAMGSGCKPGDTEILAAGSDVSILFRRLAIRLPDGSSGALSAIVSCAVRVPATLRAGRFVSEVEQMIEYGVNKTAGASAEIAATGGFDGSRPFGLSVIVPSGARREAHLTAAGTSPFMTASACRSSDEAGLFRADVAIAGNRTSSSEVLAVGAVGHDLRYDMTLSVEACP